jgi:hypothetical protein
MPGYLAGRRSIADTVAPRVLSLWCYLFRRWLCYFGKRTTSSRKSFRETHSMKLKVTDLWSYETKITKGWGRCRCRRLNQWCIASLEFCTTGCRKWKYCLACTAIYLPSLSLQCCCSWSDLVRGNWMMYIVAVDSDLVRGNWMMYVVAVDSDLVRGNWTMYICSTFIRCGFLLQMEPLLRIQILCLCLWTLDHDGLIFMLGL